MFDERFVDAPNEFRVGRPEYMSMMWGYGIHTCFGQYINRVQIPGVLQPLLRRQNLRRASGDACAVRLHRTFPHSLRCRVRGRCGCFRDLVPAC